MTPFVLLQDDWIQIAPLGDHPHQLGIQRIDAQAVAAMANRFNSFSARLGRLFSGVPLFEGHHDTDPDKYPNGKSFAWVMELQDRAANGLWGRVKWTNEGRALVTSGNYKFISPVWNAREIAREHGRPVFRPENLLSLALTNLPNLPLPPLANEQQSMKKLTEILNIAEDSTPDAICAAAETLAGRMTTLENQLRTQDSELRTAQARLISMILDNSIRAGQITLAQRAEWQSKLQQDLAAAEAALANCAPALNTTSVTRDLGEQKQLLANEQTWRAELVAYLAEKQASGMSYDDAWTLAKKERSALFEQMSRK